MNGIFKIQKIYFKVEEKDLNVIKMFERCLFTAENAFKQYKAQRICKEVIDRFTFVLAYCPYKRKAHKVCEKVNYNKVDYSILLTLRYVPDWFVICKMLEVLCNNKLDFNKFYKLFTCYNKYTQHKAYKTEICKELISITWHS